MALIGDISSVASRRVNSRINQDSSLLARRPENKKPSKNDIRHEVELNILVENLYRGIIDVYEDSWNIFFIKGRTLPEREKMRENWVDETRG